MYASWFIYGLLLKTVLCQFSVDYRKPENAWYLTKTDKSSGSKLYEAKIEKGGSISYIDDSSASGARSFITPHGDATGSWTWQKADSYPWPKLASASAVNTELQSLEDSCTDCTFDVRNPPHLTTPAAWRPITDCPPGIRVCVYPTDSKTAMYLKVDDGTAIVPNGGEVAIRNHPERKMRLSSVTIIRFKISEGQAKWKLKRWRGYKEEHFGRSEWEWSTDDVNEELENISKEKLWCAFKVFNKPRGEAPAELRKELILTNDDDAIGSGRGRGLAVDRGRVASETKEAEHHGAGASADEARHEYQNQFMYGLDYGYGDYFDYNDYEAYLGDYYQENEFNALLQETYLRGYFRRFRNEESQETPQGISPPKPYYLKT
eukprot:743087_1